MPKFRTVQNCRSLFGHEHALYNALIAAEKELRGKLRVNCLYSMGEYEIICHDVAVVPFLISAMNFLKVSFYDRNGFSIHIRNVPPNMPTSELYDAMQPHCPNILGIEMFRAREPDACHCGSGRIFLEKKSFDNGKFDFWSSQLCVDSHDSYLTLPFPDSNLPPMYIRLWKILEPNRAPRQRNFERQNRVPISGSPQRQIVWGQNSQPSSHSEHQHSANIPPHNSAESQPEMPQEQNIINEHHAPQPSQPFNDLIEKNKEILFRGEQQILALQQQIDSLSSSVSSLNLQVGQLMQKLEQQSTLLAMNNANVLAIMHHLKIQPSNMTNTSNQRQKRDRSQDQHLDLHPSPPNKKPNSKLKQKENINLQATTNLPDLPP